MLKHEKAKEGSVIGNRLARGPRGHLIESSLWRKSSNVCVCAKGALDACPVRLRRARRRNSQKGLSGLAMLSDADLKARWQDLYGIEPPPRIDRSLLIPAIAHRMQEQTLGGLNLRPGVI